MIPNETLAEKSESSPQDIARQLVAYLKAENFPDFQNLLNADCKNLCENILMAKVYKSAAAQKDDRYVEAILNLYKENVPTTNFSYYTSLLPLKAKLNTKPKLLELALSYVLPKDHELFRKQVFGIPTYNEEDYKDPYASERHQDPRNSDDSDILKNVASVTFSTSRYQKTNTSPQPSTLSPTTPSTKVPRLELKR